MARLDCTKVSCSAASMSLRLSLQTASMRQRWHVLHSPSVHCVIFDTLQRSVATRCLTVLIPDSTTTIFWPALNHLGSQGGWHSACTAHSHDYNTKTKHTKLYWDRKTRLLVLLTKTRRRKIITAKWRKNNPSGRSRLYDRNSKTFNTNLYNNN